jgi:ankyrin repeat protein
MEIIEDSHPIFKACHEGDAEIVDSFIKDGVSVYAKGEMTPSLVGTSTSLGHLEVLKVLLSHDLDPNRPINRFLTTPLIQSIAKGFDDLARLLIEFGADVQQEDKFGTSPLLAAVCNGHFELADTLIQMGADRSADKLQFLIQAARENQVSALDYIVEKLHFDPAILNDLSAKSENPLIVAAKKGNYEAAKWLLDHGADKTVKDRFRKTALDWAEANGHQRIVELLSEA